MKLSNCEFWAKTRQVQRGGVIVYMPSPYSKTRHHRNPGIVSRVTAWPLLWLAGVVTHFAFFLLTGSWRHVAWAESLSGPWVEFGPMQRVKRSPFGVLLFEGQEQPLSNVYKRMYKAPQ